MRIELGFIAVMCLFHVRAQSIVGKWKSMDDNTGEEKSIVEIYQKGDLYFGKILSLYLDPSEDQDPVCNKCDLQDERFHQKIIGMEIIRDLRKKDNEFADGTILDPEDGNIYNCKLWIEEDGKLRVRGYILFLFRTQIWHPYEK